MEQRATNRDHIATNIIAVSYYGNEKLRREINSLYIYFQREKMNEKKKNKNECAYERTNNQFFKKNERESK